MLRPILRNVILSYTQPDNVEVRRFWNTIDTQHPKASGMNYLAGWITAFCFWDESGRSTKCQANSLTLGLTLDKVVYPVIGIDNVPVGFASMPVVIDEVLQYTIVAGSVGIQARQLTCFGVAPSWSVTEKEARLMEPLALNSIQPLSGWWIYENDRSPAAEARDRERRAIMDELNLDRRRTAVEGPLKTAEECRHHITLLKRLRGLDSVQQEVQH